MIGLQKGTKALQVMQVSYNITGGERAVLVVVARSSVRYEIVPVPVVSVARVEEAVIGSCRYLHNNIFRRIAKQLFASPIPAP
jgi:hypothetical protein